MLIASMIETMYECKGVGLAAPQVGINEQIFVADIGEGPFAVINPHISKKRGSDVMEEGCLCMPGVVVKVRRPKKIFVSYIDENNEKIKQECDSLLARVFQHETDHLHGKLFIDYASWARKLKLKKQLAEIRKQSKDILKNDNPTNQSTTVMV